jgi:hypothetical protein
MAVAVLYDIIVGRGRRIGMLAMPKDFCDH